MIRKRKRDNVNIENRGIIDLTSLGTTGPELKKRKMIPPNLANRFQYSYEDQIESNADIVAIEDSADHDIEYSTNIFNTQRDLPADPESRDDLSAERSIAHGLDIRDGGQGIQPGSVEITIYPETGLRVTKRLV